MPKLVKAWVQTHIQADGKKFFTAHTKYVSKLFWIIPIFFYESVGKIWSTTVAGFDINDYGFVSSDDLTASHHFETKMDAESVLLDLINIHLDQINEKKNNKVIKRSKEYIPLCPINNIY